MADNLKELLIVDLELTCQESKKEDPSFINEIIEVGICRLNLKTLEISEPEGILIKPLKSYITPFCTELTSITQEMLDKDGLTYNEAVTYIVQKYKSREKGWASWGIDDLNCLEKNDKLYKNPYPLFSHHHTNIKHQFSVLNNHSKEFGLSRALEMSNLKLEGTHHRGMYDAYNAAQIWKSIIEQFRKKQS